MCTRFLNKTIRRAFSSVEVFRCGSRQFRGISTHLLRFPQWQGSDIVRHYESAKIVGDIVAEVLQPNSESIVPVSPESATKIEKNNVVNLQALISQASAARQSLEASKLDRVFTAGGDCGVEVSPISYLNGMWPDLVVVWFGAQAGLNSSASSPSGLFSGMPVRTLLGEGPEDITQLLVSTLQPSQVLYVGNRHLDPPEQIYIEEKEMFCMQQIHPDWQRLSRTMENFRHAYLHVDLDVLDPNEFPYVSSPTKGGLRSENLVQGIERIVQALPVVGCGITGFSADLDAYANDLHAEDLLYFVVEALAKAVRKPEGDYM